MAGQQSSSLFNYIILLSTILNVVLTSTELKQIVSKERVHVGDTWTLSCMVTMDNQNSVMVKVFKRVGSAEFEIAFNRFLDQTFMDTGRYTQVLQLLNTTANGPTEFTLTLQITDVQPGDAGVIGCAIPSENLEASNKLIVYSPIDEIKLGVGDPGGNAFQHSAEGQTLEFPEGTIQTVTCRVKGSLPVPMVFIASEGIQITDQFEKTQFVSESDDQPGLQVSNYRTLLTKVDFNVSYAYHNKMLTCSAVVPGSSFDEISRSFRIRLSAYSPKIDCGTYRPAAVIGKPFTLSCVISAIPPVNDVKINWYNDDDEELKTVNNAPYRSQVHPMDDEEKTNVTLTIDKVKKSHLREYVFEAENDFGRSKEIVEVFARAKKRDPAKVVTADAANWHITPYFLLLLVTMATKLMEE